MSAYAKDLHVHLNEDDHMNDRSWLCTHRKYAGRKELAHGCVHENDCEYEVKVVYLWALLESRACACVGKSLSVRPSALCREATREAIIYH